MDEELRGVLEDINAKLHDLLQRVQGTVVAAPAPTDADSLPDPVPGEGIASYTARCGAFVGGPKGEQAVRAAGSMFLTGQYLVDKHGGSWKKAVWEFIHGDPAYKPDPAWGGYRPGQ
jgi:hypothetical protein